MSLSLLKRLWAGAFGGALAIAGTTVFRPPGWGLARHDALFLIAAATRFLFLPAFRLETPGEAV